MARIVDYQFDNFDRNANHEAIVVNAGTSGSANDAVMYTGQCLGCDGVDDVIETEIYPDETYLSLITCMTYHGEGLSVLGNNDGTDRRFYIGVYVSRFRLAYGDQYLDGPNDSFPLDTTGVLIQTADPNTLTLNGWKDGEHHIVDHSYTRDSGASTSPFVIGQTPGSDNFYNPDIRYVIILSATLTQADVDYIFNNPSAILDMLLSGTQNPNLSFGRSDILHYIPFDEGTGNSVYDLVTGDEYQMVNFPTDDTQWTNDDEDSHDVQMSRYKKDAHHNPSGLADPHTIRFD